MKVLAVSLLFAALFGAAAAGDAASDVAALKALETCSGELQAANLGWTGADACAWTGQVKCDPVSMRVKEVKLSGMELTDTTGTCLTNLDALDAAVALILDNNKLATVPAAISTIPGLNTVDLTKNMLTDVNDLFSKSQNHTKTLYASGNQLTGTLNTASCDHLDSIKYLDLGNNQISGDLPACFFALGSSLQYAYLNNNQFSGGFGANVAQLASLRSLWIHSNSFTSAWPTATFSNANNMPNLEEVRATGSGLSGPLGLDARLPDFVLLGTIKVYHNATRYIKDDSSTDSSSDSSTNGGGMLQGRRLQETVTQNDVVWTTAGNVAEANKDGKFCDIRGRCTATTGSGSFSAGQCTADACSKTCGVTNQCPTCCASVSAPAPAPTTPTSPTTPAPAPANDPNANVVVSAVGAASSTSASAVVVFTMAALAAALF